MAAAAGRGVRRASSDGAHVAQLAAAAAARDLRRATPTSSSPTAAARTRSSSAGRSREHRDDRADAGGRSGAWRTACAAGRRLGRQPARLDAGAARSRDARRRRRGRRHARSSWAGGAPLLFGGDLNLRGKPELPGLRAPRRQPRRPPLREPDGRRPTSRCSSAGRLSDHPPVRVSCLEPEAAQHQHRPLARRARLGQHAELHRRRRRRRRTRARAAAARRAAPRRRRAWTSRKRPVGRMRPSGPRWVPSSLHGAHANVAVGQPRAGRVHARVRHRLPQPLGVARRARSAPTSGSGVSGSS